MVVGAEKRGVDRVVGVGEGGSDREYAGIGTCNGVRWFVRGVLVGRKRTGRKL